MKYEYMVVYVFPNGSARTFIVRNLPINSAQAVEELEALLRKQNNMSFLHISNFVLLREYAENED